MTATAHPKISATVIAGRDSKYLARFIMSFLAKTERLRSDYYDGAELLVMTNASDVWNEDLQHVVEMLASDDVRWFTEDKDLGRYALHVLWNDLVHEARGDWTVYFCDDHLIVKDGWDEELLHAVRELDPSEPWALIPRFDNGGSMNHVLSRGWIERTGHVGMHGSIDSYLNEVCGLVPDRVLHAVDPWFHDFTHDVPSPMAGHPYTPGNTDNGAVFSEADGVAEAIAEDARRIRG